MGEREEDESTADVEDIVGGQTHHQEMEVSLSSPAAEHQDADGVADEADAEHDQLKINHLYLVHQILPWKDFHGKKDKIYTQLEATFKKRTL